MGLDEEEYFFEQPVVIPVTDVLDLHTVPARDVGPIVEAYLDEARLKGLRHVRIIHGKGIGVRRETVRKILARTSFVEVFGDAPLEAGGWGATVATLSLEEAKPSGAEGANP